MIGSVGSRIFLSAIAVVLVGLVAAAIAVSGLLLRYENEVTRQRLNDTALPLVTAAQAALKQGRTTREVVQSLTEQAKSAQARILIVEPRQRRIIVDSDGTMEGHTLPALPGGTDIGLFTQGEQEWVFLQRLVGPAGAVVVARPRALLADTLRALLPALATSALVAIGFALLVAALLARSITRPLRDLVAGTRRFAAGNYRTRVPVGGPTEVHELGTAFNDMADEVERSRGSEHAFLADISHELRTPLTSIQGFSQAIVEGEVHGDGVGWAARVIQREARRLIKMVEGLLQVSRLEAGAQRMARERLVLEEIVRGAMTALEVQAKEAAVAIEEQLQPLPAVVGDRDRLAQLFVNVLDNAVKHSPRGSAVRLSGERRNGEVVVRVTDAGSGLPPGGEELVFERFYRGDNAAREGAGLGLAIAQAIAQAHGGRIEARNARGGGAEFAVVLPVAEASRR